MSRLSDIGLIGLAVMGENLALNMERNGFHVSVYNRAEGAEADVVKNFIRGRAAGKNFLGFTDLKDFVASVQRPRKIMMMIRAGKPVDMVIEGLLPYLEAGDIVIDGGNSNWEDSERREAYLRQHGIYFVGAGISGGEEGALNGPAIMPGGAVEAWEEIRPIFQKISAKAKDGSPCCSWVGSGGSGHFVKMVHNGIEYGDMQLIAEAYGMMKLQPSLTNEKMSEVLASWNEGKLNSYLIEISAAILAHRDADGSCLIDKILDTAGQKGTGKWSVINSLEYGTPLNLIASAVYERSLSANKDLRVEVAKAFVRRVDLTASEDELVCDLHDCLYASKLVSYAQGFGLMQEASHVRGWGLDLASIAKLWRAGCIIRSGFLEQISRAYEQNPELIHLLLDDYFRGEIEQALPAWQRLVALATLSGVPVQAFSTALNYFYSLTSERLPANMIQAQRDYFGAHTFERVDRPRGEFFHENWTGYGGNTSSSTYNV
ncbi:decarboxylating NADP(+)-dependent phosphogluconate dehydrogenase [Porphyromonas sp. COT-290 OH3588]|uniref:decarboxylating NADP(+)-dependent phosphogluconate dehydrogenase n=1 Tax=Porphyromonas sp. COT-290 OH3588 TaxID=1515617 RepID=UPI00052E13B8|nr:decarboxylating NADP(+)-dependent phosphogluconate dehydrogenase [Porphyromonas sp. COT-290 OH3588]KGO00254.1 6-phosphogluconate dehydrogenase [Porphyromonas sp. COT-290 OH3588]